MLQESLEQRIARRVPGERFQEEDATEGRSKRRKLQEVKALGIEDSMRWGLYEEALGGEGSMSGEFSRRIFLQEAPGGGGI